MRNREKYPVNWSDTIRPAILARDHYTCQRCGLKHRSIYGKLPTGKRVTFYSAGIKRVSGHYIVARTCYLQIAHLDHNAANNHYSNLQALCPSCHTSYDSAHRTISRISKPVNQ